MSLTNIWGYIIVFVLSPLWGGLPLIDWIFYAFTGRHLNKLGTGNISVSAAFYHGGRWVGILAVLSEATKGIAIVLLTRLLLTEPAWQLVALITLVMGRYFIAKGAGTTNVVWGIITYDWQAALLVLIIGGVSFTIWRERKTAKIVILVLVFLIITLRHANDLGQCIAVFVLVTLLAWIYSKIPDDLDLSKAETHQKSEKMFRFFSGDRNLISLDNLLDKKKVGAKAANLSQLKQWGYSVPDGWILPPGDDPQPLLEFLQPTPTNPLIVRSSAIGEDSASASAAGQYQSKLNITTREELTAAILECLSSYNNPQAIQYRQDRQQEDQTMAVIIQKQIKGIFSGVAFSRDPLEQLDQAVVIEALPGDASQVVSGKVTPQLYRVYWQENTKQIEGSGDIPPVILEAIASIVRELETLYHGIPQDVEWSYDGQHLWLLQTRPITNLQPIWTRKIAAEVIPGIIRPLTWSINRPLTCGVWGQIFTLVLGKRAQGLDFNQTATLHYQRAYFNATLLGAIFRRMGLPPESLDFLIRGTKLTKPSLNSTLKNLPGLLRLLQKEWHLEKDFQQQEEKYFIPILAELNQQKISDLSPSELIIRIDKILAVLEQATYFSILAPLSFALRQAVLKVSDLELDNSQTPEIKSMRSLANLAADARKLLPKEDIQSSSCPSLFSHLAENSDTKNILDQFQQWLEKYGYLSEVATDISISRWQEDPYPVKNIFTQFYLQNSDNNQTQSNNNHNQNWLTQIVQKRLNLKAKVTEIYSRLLAHLRWSFIALENIWLTEGILNTKGDIFYLELTEIRHLIHNCDPEINQLIQTRKLEFQQNQKIKNIPYVVYGNPPTYLPSIDASLTSNQLLQGIGASPGETEGYIKIVHNFANLPDIDSQTILVVPYTDSGWSPLLARAGGLISEVGGRLSHGAIIAREYQIPAVMDINHATQLLKNGQKVRLDGKTGIVQILEE